MLRREVLLATFVLLSTAGLKPSLGAWPPILPCPDQAMQRTSNYVAVSDSFDVVVVGAGIAGLTAAYSLAADGYSIRVLEKNQRVGGRTVSGHHQGLSYAKGTEYLGQPSGVLAEIIDELDLQPREIPSPMDAIFRDGQFYYGEDGIALMFIERSSLIEFNRFMVTVQEYCDSYDDPPDFEADSELAELDEITAREWLVREGFSEIFQETYNVAARGLFGANIDEVSALSFIPEIGFDFEDTDPVEDPEDLDNFPIPDEETWSYSFTTGITEVTNALAEDLGDTVRLGSTVIEIHRPAGALEYLVDYEDEGGTSHTVSAQVVILAVPAPVALSITSGLLSAEQSSLLAQIPYSSYVTVFLFTEQPVATQAFDLGVEDGLFFTDVYDSTWVQRYYDPGVPGGIHIMGIYVASASYHDSDLLTLPDDELLDSIFDDLEPIFPGLEATVQGYDIERFAYAYPVMTPGAYTRLTRLHEITTRGLLLAGDYMVYPTFEAAAESGHLAAEKARTQLESAAPGAIPRKPTGRREP